MTDEQAIMLAKIEQEHGAVKRIPDDSEVAEELLGQCVSDTRAYCCARCQMAFTVEPDGECQIWALADS